MGIKFKFFEAGDGDSILISTKKGTNLLIDAGFGKNYRYVIDKEVVKLKKLDLVVLTHMDKDHICGLIEMVKNHKESRKKIKELWFNSMRSVRARQNKNVNIGYGNAKLFDKLLEKHKIPVKDDIFLKDKFDKKKYIINNEIELTLLSPLEIDLENLEREEPKNQKAEFCNNIEAKNISYKRTVKNNKLLSDIDIDSTIFGKDSELANMSSIAFILKYGNKQFLFLGDANIETVNKSLNNLNYSKSNRLKVEFVKLSHHGSKNNINSDFLDIVETSKFISLTEGKSKNNNHPNKETFALILNHKNRAKNIEFIFNYKDLVRKKISKKEEERYSLENNGLYSFRAYNKSILNYERGEDYDREDA